MLVTAFFIAHYRVDDVILSFIDGSTYWKCSGFFDLLAGVASYELTSGTVDHHWGREVNKTLLSNSVHPGRTGQLSGNPHVFHAKAQV